jgi:hypothetical protein
LEFPHSFPVTFLIVGTWFLMAYVTCDLEKKTAARCRFNGVRMMRDAKKPSSSNLSTSDTEPNTLSKTINIYIFFRKKIIICSYIST